MSTTPDWSENAPLLEKELYFLIAKFLSNGPCAKAAEVLKQELTENKLLLKRIDWEGEEHFRSYQNLVDLYRHIAPNHLLKICERICPLLDKEVKPSVAGVISLLGAGRQSALRTQEDVRFIQWGSSIHLATHNGRPLAPPHNLSPVPNIIHVLDGRTMCGVVRRDHALPTRMYSKIGLLSRTLGHLSAVYCVMFDQTGQYIITGADDHLVKIWSTETGRLLSTLRGHAAEITDMAVSHENTLLAAGSCDKLIRVWCLRTASPVAVLHGHTGMITSVQFCPYTRGETRYLLSTGGDGCVCFWLWNVNTFKFSAKPIKFIERSRAGAQMLCSSFSPGGVFLATGSTDHVLRVYCFTASAPEKICELESHTDRVDSIQYANKCIRFVSGSKDGTARIWRYERQEWKAIVLNMNQKSNGSVSYEPEDKLNKPKVTMVSWTADDIYVATAVTDLSVKVWNSQTGNLVYNLTGHEEEVFVVEANPVDSRILLTAGHDGHIKIWDLSDGSLIKTHYNNIQGQGHGAVYDTKWSPDGHSFAATDSHGYLRYFGHGSNEKYKRLPEEVFFHTDYRPLIRDANNYVLDEQTQQPPHLMPPPFLVDIDGNPHHRDYQRLVPGREHATGNSLVPEMGVTPSGNREVLGDAVELEEPVPGPSVDPPPPPLPPVAPPTPTHQPDTGEPALIDSMIALMQRTQDRQIARAGGEPLHSPPRRESVGADAHRAEGPLSPSARGPRRSGDVEGVRQSHGNVPVSHRATANDLVAWSRRVIVKELDPVIAKTSHRQRLNLAEEEVKLFVHERKRKPLPPSENDSSDSGSYMRTRKRQRARGSRAHSGLTEETGRNRLTTRALYDTEEEEDSNQSTQEEVHDDSEENVWHSDSSDHSDSSEYSDWAADGGATLQPPKRQSQRQPKPKRKMSSSEEEEEDNESEEEPVTPPVVKPVKEKKPKPLPKRRASKRERQKKLFDSKGDIHELPEEFKPPEWLSATIPRKAPYFPQMGDEVIYFRQGHEQYVHAVKNRKVYDIEVNKNQPWHKMPSLREQELVKVVGIKIEVKPPRLVCLKLAIIDPESGKITGGSFSIKYHDMPDVIDFLVLRQTYDTAMRRNWKVGDHFRALIDDAWWLGKIESQEPFQEEYVDSMFQCFNVHWDNGEVEKMSPWDLEPLDNIDLPSRRGGSVPVTTEELRSLQYLPKASEWPGGNRDAECDRIAHGMEQIMELAVAEYFSAPVDLNAFPIYAMVIEYPMDLSTIKARLENRFYRRVTAVQFDVRYVETNAKTFNQPSSQIVKYAKLCSEVCLRFISDSSCTDAMSIYSELTQDVDFAVNPALSRHMEDGSDSEEVDVDEAGPSASSSSTRRNSKQKKGSQVAPKPDQWKDECRLLLELIIECEDAAPFRSAVDPIDYPEYYETIDTPMDLETVREHLQIGAYETPIEFCKDMRLVFNNSKAYNTNKKSRIYSMTLRISAMFEDQIKDIMSDWKSNKRFQKSGRLHPSYKKKFSSRGAHPSSSRRSRGPSTRNANSSMGSSSQHDSSFSSPASGRATRSQGASGSSNQSRPQRTGIKRQRISSDEDGDGKDKGSDSDDSDDSEFEVERLNTKNARSSRRTKKPPPKKSSKGKLVNGHSNPGYSTRCQTGILKRRRYDSEAEEEEKSAESASSGSSDSEVAAPSKRNNRASAKKTNGNVTQTRSGRQVKRKKPPTTEEEEEEDSEDKKSSDESDSDSSLDKGGNSGSATEDYSAGEEEPPPLPKRTVRSANKRLVKAKQEVTPPSEGENRRTSGRVPKQRNLGEEYLYDHAPTRNTRNQGRRTVRYEEGSDNEYGIHVNNTESEGERERDGSGSGEETMNVSSRGRVRKLTPRARAMLRD